MSEVKFSKKTIIGIIIGLLILVAIIFLLIRGCTNKMYTVIFDSNGGTKIESVKVEKNKKVDMPSDPEKSGYEFVGWYYNDELFNFDTKITKDITLKAHWTKSGVKLSSSILNMVVGESKKIEFSVLPDGLSEKDFIFSSSNEDIVIVDEKGNIKAIKSGTAIISIKSKDGKYETICNITITEKTVEIESVTISGDNSVGVGNIIKLSVKFNPDNATSGKLKWESSNESIATVDENGIVKGVKAGTVTIKVTTENGKTATKNITVKEVTTSQNNNNNSKPNTSGGNTGGNTPSKPSEVLPSSVSISGENVVYVGNTIQLTATVLPNNATSKSVTWKSNDTSIASVDQTGRVTGNAAGSTTITVTTKNGKTATYQITVKEKEASYVIHLKVYTKGMEGEVLQYSYRITKNGADFSDYSSFTINGTKYLKTNSNPTMDGKVVTNGGSNTATIKLSDSSEKTLSVVFE